VHIFGANLLWKGLKSHLHHETQANPSLISSQRDTTSFSS
jgi:hypothetical protein